MKVEDAAQRLEMNPQTLRLALQQGLFPFGCAIRTSEKRFTYYINENRLKKYLKGVDYEKDFNTNEHNNRSITNGVSL